MCPVTYCLAVRPRGHASAARPMAPCHAALRPIGPCGLAVQMPVFIMILCPAGAAPPGPFLCSARPPGTSSSPRKRRQVRQGLARPIAAAHAHAMDGAGIQAAAARFGAVASSPSGSRAQQAAPAPTPKPPAAGPIGLSLLLSDADCPWPPPSVGRNPGRGQPSGCGGRACGPAGPPLG